MKKEKDREYGRMKVDVREEEDEEKHMERQYTFQKRERNEQITWDYGKKIDKK